MNRVSALACLLLAAFLLPACKHDPKGHSENSDDSGLREPTAQAREDIEPLTNDNNEFALDLYARQIRGDDNVFFSPMSISLALAMVHAGARGETAEQMAKTLHFNLDGDRLNSAFGAFQWDLNRQGEDGGYQLHIANAIWGDNRWSFHNDFLDLLRDKYGSRLRTVSFKDKPQEVSDAINDWVNGQTHEKIKNIVSPDDFSEGPSENDTVFLLVNAIYFKGEWNTKFQKKSTKGDTFYLKSRDGVQVPFMAVTGNFRYMATGSFQALEMPYKGKDVSLIAFLPRARSGITEFEKDLTAEKLAGWIKKMRSEKVEVIFPPFKLETQFDLPQTLQDLGIKDAFGSKADFKGMADTPIYLGFVRHRAFIELNEEGTEAAGATAVKGSKASSSGGHDDEPPVFRADHPFLFLIRENKSGSILFLGRIMDPRR
jgi:serpin B